jgi:hypothetical protein
MLPLSIRREKIAPVTGLFEKITRVAIRRYLCIFEKWVNYAQFVGFLVYLKLDNA